MEWAGLLTVVEKLGPLVALLVALIVALAKDMLITRGQVERLLAVKDEMIRLEQRRGDEWKATVEVERAARLASDEQVADLLEVAEVQGEMIRAIQAAVVGKKAS